MIVRPARKGLTLVETLVVIGIIAIVVAITIPAVMSAREAARRTQCLNNLKQLSLATNLHLEQKNYYPREENGYSAFVLMLPFLEQPALFNAFNLTTSRDIASGPNDVNYTAYSTRVSTFVCPSEVAPATPFGRSSYGGNLGTGVGKKYLSPDNGPFASSSLDPKIRDGMIRDGLANTVAISEFCQTNGPRTPRTGRAVFQLGAYGAGQFDAMIADCQNVDVNSQAMSRIFRGFCWAFAGLDNTEYDHNIPPNGHACSSHGLTAGAVTASSYHNGGVNSAHLDGHVSYVRDGIAMAAWRALGTMAGGEIVSDQSP